MEFLSIRDRYTDMLWADSKTERFKQGALMVGAVLANTAIGAGKVTGEVVKRLPDFLAKENERIKTEVERRKQRD